MQTSQVWCLIQEERRLICLNIEFRETNSMRSAAVLKKSTKVRPSIEVSALAAVMLALLLTFMVTTVYQWDLPIKAVELAKAHHSIPLPGAMRENALRIVVRRDGVIFLGVEQIPSGQLAARLRAGLRNGPESRVYIEADAHAKYGEIVEVLDMVRAAGIEKVSFLTRPGEVSLLKR